jgi:tetratricopeptide (TPR) repeat protein
MSRVEKAIESGKCVVAVGAALLRDPEVMFALRARQGLQPMALSGPAVAHVAQGVTADALGPALAHAGGLVVLVEPEAADAAGVKALGEILQRSRQKPELLIIARAYNPFAFGQSLAGLRVQHDKNKGKPFLQALPEVAPAAAPVAEDGAPEVKKAKPLAPGEIAAPKFVFAGRDAEGGGEVDALAALLGAGGPIVVHGPSGVGRTQVVEHAIKKAGLQRLPDLWLGWGMGHDTLATRLAYIGKEVGDDRLFDVLKGAHTAADVNRAALEVLGNPALQGKVFVIRELEKGMGRDQDFFRRSRLELLLLAMLTGTAALPVVFISTRVPTFHREGEAQHLRKFEVGGVKGRFLHEIFEANKAIDFPRDKYGPIWERIHGHAFAAKTFAIATRIRQDGLAAVEDPKFYKMESVGDLGPTEKQIERRLEKLPEELRTMLARLAHLRIPVDGATLSNELGVSRNGRLELLSLGLLEICGTEEDRRYRVHPIVRSQLAWREVADFDVCARLADMYAAMANNAQGLQRLAYEQECSRFAVAGRALKLRPRFELPDHDMVLEMVEGLIRSKQPRLDLADQRLAEVLRQNPHNADAWLLQMELVLSSAEDVKVEAIDPIFEAALAKAPVPELFQQVVSWQLARRQRTRAIAVLEQGVALFPTESRLHTRLAAVLQRVGRRNEAIEHLKKAMEIDPMLPDSYGLLGLARREEGLEALGEAETLLREAVRLAPEDPTQIGRLADLLLERARVDTDQAVTLRAEARTLLEEAIKGDRRAPEACLLLATLVREEGGDPERASWLLGQAKKLTDRGHERARRITVERAMIDLAKGDFDSAEQALRQHIGKDPSHGRAFAALGHVLEGRDQYIPAHGEYLRAKERAAQNSLEAKYYDQLLLRVQAIIEAQAAGLFTPTERPEFAKRALQPAPPSQRVLRRRRGAEGEEAAPEAAETAPVAHDDEPAEATEPEAPVDAPVAGDEPPPQPAE